MDSQQKRNFQKIVSWVLGGGLTIAAIGGLIWFVATRPPIPESEIISKKGIHWHSELTIYMKGVKQEIPANIGIGAVHQPIHTHDAIGTIHLEFQGLVRKQDITLGQFFKNWGKDMQSFGSNMRPSDERGSTEASRSNMRPSDERGSTEASRPNVRMTVNGEENIEYENYVMHDKDIIELRFE